jgi:hypothetical protein
MRKIALAALAVAPLFGGAAFAASSYSGDYAYKSTQVGPEAYSPQVIARWYQQHRDEMAAQAQQGQANGYARQGAPTTVTE